MRNDFMTDGSHDANQMPGLGSPLGSDDSECLHDANQMCCNSLSSVMHHQPPPPLPSKYPWPRLFLFHPPPPFRRACLTPSRLDMAKAREAKFVPRMKGRRQYEDSNANQLFLGSIPPTQPSPHLTSQAPWGMWCPWWPMSSLWPWLVLVRLAACVATWPHFPWPPLKGSSTEWS